MFKGSRYRLSKATIIFRDPLQPLVNAGVLSLPEGRISMGFQRCPRHLGHQPCWHQRGCGLNGLLSNGRKMWETKNGEMKYGWESKGPNRP